MTTGHSPVYKGRPRKVQPLISEQPPSRMKPVLGHLCQDARNPVPADPKSLNGQRGLKVRKTQKAGTLRGQCIQARYKESGEGCGRREEDR